MIIEAFNLVFIGLLLFFALLTFLIWYFFRDKSEKFRKHLIIYFSVFNIVFFFVYKIFLSIDREYLAISNITSFNWWNELPLQLCNINMFIIPLSLILNKKFLMGFAFFIAPLGAFMAFLFPETAFSGYSLLLMRNIGFYFTHGFIIVLAISLCTLGFFKPSFRLIPSICATLVFLAVIMHGVNMLLRATVCSYTNYFYTFPVDISLLSLFYQLISIPLLYLLPGLVILGIYAGLITLPFTLKHKE